eukprot:SAG31_NODE_15632_length_745_cov_1.284830_1_plen_51_part_00
MIYVWSIVYVINFIGLELGAVVYRAEYSGTGYMPRYWYHDWYHDWYQVIH